jgi:predicted anti-sigma-YlaC factor YlaD
MITRMPRSCVVHRAALLDFVDGQPQTAASAAALSHLERCRTCEDELAGIVRTVAALRRLGVAVADVEPSPHVWPMVRARVTARRGDRWLPRFSIAGMAMSAALVVMISLPTTISPGGTDWSYSEFRVTGHEATPRVVAPAQRPARGGAATSTSALTASSALRFNRRVYGEAPWSPEAGVPKPRPR